MTTITEWARRLAVLLAMGAPALAWAHSDPGAFSQSAERSRKVVEVRLPANTAGGVVALAGVRSDAPGKTLRAYGRVVPSADAVLDVNSLFSGQVAEVFVRPGDSVTKGQPILSIFNPEFITTQRGHLELLRNEEKLQTLREEGRLPDYLKDARENLRWWGMTDGEITALIEKGVLVNDIMLRAPATGYITDVFAQPGSLVNAGDRSMGQFVVIGRSVARMVSDDKPLWVEGYVYADERAALRPGLKASIQLPAGRRLEGAISQVVPGIDPVSQRARFLVELGGRTPGVSAGQAVELALALKDPATAGSGAKNRDDLWVPRQSVLGQRIDPVVYVRAASDRFLRKPVTVRRESADWLQVTGVDPGDQVVVDGKMILEGVYRMSGNQGAGTGGHHHH